MTTESPQQLRRDRGPMTQRGEARKQLILEAARREFDARGFAPTRVADIVKAAGVSHGTFYTYFDTKEDVFKAVSQEVIDSMLTSLAPQIPLTRLDERIDDMIRRFIAAYRPHARMLGLMEEVGTQSEEMRLLRLAARDVFIQRSQHGIANLKLRGLTDPELDVEYTAEVLGVMLEYTCYLWFCLRKEFDESRLIEALSSVWKGALQPSGDLNTDIEEQRAAEQV